VSGRRVLITGAASGIGLATATAFARLGDQVWLADVAVDRLETEVAALRSAGLDVEGVGMDVADAGSVDEAVTRAVAAGPLDVLHVNAGIAAAEVPLAEIPVETIERLVRVNLVGALLTARAAVPHLSDGGRIVFTASTSGLAAHPFASPYAATKIALVGVARCLAAELAPRRITVNSVCPGGVDTPLPRSLYSADVIEEAAAVNPLGRIADPEDVAAAVLFLASAQARHVNAVALRVDGGEAMAGAV
jgi:NAD(P)-dependent dehydrogenase (short-subunit alcohol dehydrogenase family)